MLEAHATTGPGDLHCRVVARTNAHLQHVLGRVLEVPGIVRTTTQIALSEQVRHRVLPLVAQVIDDADRPLRPARAAEPPKGWGAAPAPAVGSSDGRARPCRGHRHALRPLGRCASCGRHAGRHRRRVVLATVFSVLNKIFDVAPELLIGAAVDVVVNDGRSFIGRLFGVDDRFEQLTILAVVTVVVWVLESITDYIADITWRNLAQDVEHDVRMEAYAHVQELELAYFEDRSSGGLMAVLNDDVNQLERFLDVGANEVILTVANVVLVGLAFVVISPTVAVLAFLPIPIIVVGSLRYQRSLEKRYDAVRAAAGRIADTLTNNLGGITTIKAFTAEDREVDRVAVDSRAYSDANAEAIRYSSAFIPLIRMAILAGFTMTLVVGGRAALRRRPRGRPVLVARVHDPAPALAAHRARRDARPLPAGHGVVPPHLRAPRGGAVHPARHAHALGARARRRALRRRALRLRRRCRRGAPRPRPRHRSPARPTPSSVPPGPARAPS